MKFACDSCNAQYMISDEKVGPAGVIVRCKKCQNKIVVKRLIPGEEDGAESTVVMTNPIAPLTASADLSPETTEVGSPLSAEEQPAADAPLDDELGRAFDSVLSEPSSAGELTSPGTEPSAELAGGFPFNMGAGEDPEDEDRDRQSTRVVNLAEMASLMKTEGKPAEPEEKPGSTTAEKPAEPAKAPAAVEWFVAINEQQVGPLDFEGVREHWDLGELSADSLVWNSGMPDWKPLSSVPELAGKLAPRPKPQPVEAPAASAGASGAAEQPAAPAASVLPPPQAEPEEPVWKPSAASALESLVKDELSALEKAPAKPKAEPVGVGEPTRARGLFDELPDEPERAPAAPAASPSYAQPAARAATPAPARAYEPEPESQGSHRHDPAQESEAAHEPEQRPGRNAARSAARPARDLPPAPAYVSPAPPKSKAGIFIGFGIFGGLLGVGAILALVLVVFRQPTQVVLPQPPAVQQPVEQPVAAQPPAAQPAAAQPPEAQPAAAAQPAVAQPAAAQPAAAQPAVAQPPVAQAPAAPETPVEPPKQPEPQPVAAPARSASRDDAKKSASAKRETPKRSAASGSRLPDDDDEPIRPTPTPTPTPAPTPAPSKGSSVDDDFNNLFGGGGEEKPAAEEKKPPKEKKPTVYIPPAPGSGSVKETLGQSDIMEVVVANKGAIKRCTDEQKARDPGSSGTVVMRWTILRTGKPTGIQSTTPEFKKSELSACLTGVIKSFKFPAYSGAQMQPIDFPFRF